MTDSLSSLPTTDSPGAWLMAIRPKTLPVGAAPVLVGVAVAEASAASGIRFDLAILCLVTALLLQILSNLANDFFDFKKGADTSDRLGPPRAMQQGVISRRRMKAGIATVAALSALTGGILVWQGGWTYMVLGIFAIVSAIAYTGGPFPLGYNGLGDIFVFLFFGLVAVVGTTHLCLGHIPPTVWPAACAMGLLAVNLLVVNNVRDEHQDRANGKKTVIARWGKKFGVLQYALGLLLAYMCVGAIASLTGNYYVFLTGIIAGIGVNNLKRLVVSTGKSLNPVLGKTALFTFSFGVILSAALVLPSLL
jgi:1,4-dihydroxy-2-naphthoate polyprenyltransferase